MAKKGGGREKKENQLTQILQRITVQFYQCGRMAGLEAPSRPHA